MVTMNIFSSSGIRALAITGGILFQLRNNKKYSITLNKDDTQKELHLYIYAKNIKYGDSYRYEVLISDNLGGFLYKRNKKEEHSTNFIRLSPLQFRVWEKIVFYSHPKHPLVNNQNIRSYDYGIPFGNCVTWSLWAKNVAITTMLTVPSR